MVRLWRGPRGWRGTGEGRWAVQTRRDGVVVVVVEEREGATVRQQQPVLGSVSHRPISMKLKTYH
jgi:hypothetical protein